MTCLACRHTFHHAMPLPLDCDRWCFGFLLAEVAG